MRSHTAEEGPGTARRQALAAAWVYLSLARSFGVVDSAGRNPAAPRNFAAAATVAVPRNFAATAAAVHTLAVVLAAHKQLVARCWPADGRSYFAAAAADLPGRSWRS